jgi:micrococcal nuclease
MSFDFDDAPPTAESPESEPPPGWVAPKGPRRPIARYAAAGAVALLALGVLGSIAGGQPADNRTPAPSNAAVAPTFTPAPTEVAAASLDATFAPSGPTTEARVVRVIDGDTIVVEFGGTEYHLRYIGMDTPESVKPNTPVEPMAREASKANSGLVAGQTVTLEKEVSETDSFGRLLRDVWVDRNGSLVMVGLELVRQGYAQVTTFPPDVKYVDLLLAAERSARSGGLGLWAETPSQTPTPSAAAFVVDDPQVVDPGETTTFEGAKGAYSWSTLEFAADRLVAHWTVKAASTACQIVWRVIPDEGKPITRTVRAKASQTVKGVERYDTTFSTASFAVASTCPTWTVTMQGAEAPPDSAADTCHPSYTPCLPIVDDLDCPDVKAMGKAPVRIKGPDVYRLDRDGDGLGCE